MSTDPFAPVSASGEQPASADQWTAIVPVPADAPSPPARHAKLGEPSATWRYLDAAGRLLFVASRFDQPEGKEFLPASYCRNEATGKRSWRWKGLPEPRPLYRLDALAARPDAPVIVTEGEKAADAAEQLFPEHVATTSPNGSKSARKADWSPLAGRRITIWQDNDQPGAAYAETVAELLAQAGAASVSVIEPESGLASGFDAADALAQGWAAERLSALLSGAKALELPAPDTGAEKSAAGGAKTKGRKPRKEKPRIFDFVTDDFEFWHDPDRESFVTYPVKSRFEHWPIRHRFFKNHIAGLYFEKTGEAIGASALDDSLRVMEAMAQAGECRQTWRRVARDGNAICIDLADDEWRSVKITGQQWIVGQFPHVKFLRGASARAIPAPVIGGRIEDLQPFVNVSDPGDFVLVAAWLVAALRPEGPYPLLCVSGEQGSGKSSITDLLANLVDAEIGKKRTVSKDERDLVIAAKNGHVLAFDNMSSVANWFSDALCRLSTGGGFATRALHTDNDQIVLEAQRPVVLNGIPDLTGRADLADRSIAVHLPRIGEGGRRTERELKAAFDREWPAILGALCSAVSAGLRNLDNVRLERPPRMADFAQWVVACETGFGWEPGTFLAAYEANRSDAAKVALENDPFGSELIRIVRDHRPTGYSGTATQLLSILNDHAAQAVKNMRSWPSTAAALGTLVRRAAPLLRAEGYAITDHRTAEGRMIRIKAVSAAGETGPLPD